MPARSARTMALRRFSVVVFLEDGNLLAGQFGNAVNRRIGAQDDAPGIDEDQAGEIDIGQPTQCLRRVGAIHVGLAGLHHLQTLGGGAGDPVYPEVGIADHLADAGDHAPAEIDRITGRRLALVDEGKRQRIGGKGDIDDFRRLDLGQRVGRLLGMCPGSEQATRDERPDCKSFHDEPL